MREYSIKKLIEEYPFALEFIEQNRLDKFQGGTYF